MKLHFGCYEYPWKGISAYRCLLCAYSAPGRHGLRYATAHARAKHPAFIDDQNDTLVTLKGTEFEDEAAVQAAALLTQGEAERLKLSVPSGQDGYTVADVRAAATPDTPAHEETD